MPSAASGRFSQVGRGSGLLKAVGLSVVARRSSDHPVRAGWDVAGCSAIARCQRHDPHNPVSERTLAGRPAAATGAIELISSSVPTREGRDGP